MPFSVRGYLARAEECVRLANLTKDEMLRLAILRQRQSYLAYAAQLKSLDKSGDPSVEIKPNP